MKEVIIYDEKKQEVEDYKQCECSFHDEAFGTKTFCLGVIRKTDTEGRIEEEPFYSTYDSCACCGGLVRMPD